eukprot:TRINITY_DN25561_c0_g1_i1.p1 TRINITY_DN25561_c0_g1~~TRINITY_DN25561_c0_g1_i1.p1  ORF type:complete len:395 (+),score=147.63 TRINITY_DN25561_c0_g1_i1:70-1254(+)
MITMFAVLLYLIGHFGLMLAFYPARFCFRLYTYVLSLFLEDHSSVRVVVIGGGFAGSRIAKALESQCQVTLIDTKDFFEFTPSILRSLVEPSHASALQIRHCEYLSTANCIQGVVSEITPEHVVVENWWKRISYDVLIVASGSTYNQPFKEANAVIATRANILSGCAKQLELSDSVLVIGGGSVGVELAAEVNETFPEKRVVIAHSHEKLLARLPKVARQYVWEYFEKQTNTELLLNTKVTTRTDVGYKTKDGRSVVVDVAFMCTGISPNSDFLKSFDDKCVDKRGFAVVNEYLQLEGHPNVFVAGDVSAVKEEKLAQAARLAAKVTVSNVRAYMANLKDGHKHPMQAYEPESLPMIISLGKYDAVLVWGETVFCGIVPALMKEAVEWLVMVQY